MEELKNLITDSHKYIRLKDKAKMDALISEFTEACCATELFSTDKERTNIGIDEDVLAGIIDLIRKRRLYFYVYHDIETIDDLCELKEVALYTFWILKLHPFCWREGYRGDEYKSNYELNAKVALDFFLNGLDMCATSKTESARKENTMVAYKVSIEDSDKDVINRIYYSFRYRDWSKEALMDLAESLIIHYKPAVDRKVAAYGKQAQTV
jgi:hypothetical protein